jgi:hypothetical protein
MKIEDRIIDYRDFNPNNVLTKPIVTKDFYYKNNYNVRYKELPLQYNYGDGEKMIVDDIYFQLPPCQTTGIQMVQDLYYPNDPPKFLMMLKFKLYDDDHIQCIKQIQSLHKVCCNLINKEKKELKMFDFNPEYPGYMFKSPIYYSRCQLTGNIQEGRNPSMFVKLMTNRNNESLFTYPNINSIDKKTNYPQLEPVEWSLLEDVDMILAPLIKFEKIHIGQKASLQCKLVNALILNVVKRGSQTRQLSTYSNLILSQPHFPSIITSQLQHLQNINKDDNDNDDNDNDNNNLILPQFPSIFTCQLQQFQDLQNINKDANDNDNNNLILPQFPSIFTCQLQQFQDLQNINKDANDNDMEEYFKDFYDYE